MDFNIKNPISIIKTYFKRSLWLKHLPNTDKYICILLKYITPVICNIPFISWSSDFEIATPIPLHLKFLNPPLSMRICSAAFLTFEWCQDKIYFIWKFLFFFRFVFQNSINSSILLDWTTEKYWSVVTVLLNVLCRIKLRCVFKRVAWTFTLKCKWVYSNNTYM